MMMVVMVVMMRWWLDFDMEHAEVDDDLSLDDDITMINTQHNGDDDVKHTQSHRG